MLRLDVIKVIGALQLGASGVAGLMLGCSSASTPGAEAPEGAAATETAPEPAGASTDAASDGSTGAPVSAPHGKRAPCSSDQSCNEDPAVSALWGVCTEMGVCECSEGFERSPTSDLCRPAAAR